VCLPPSPWRRWFTWFLWRCSLTRLGPALVVTVGLGLYMYSGSAQAEPHQVCLYLDIGDELWDASPRAADGKDFREEYGRNEGPLSYPAQRWLARVRDESTGTVVFGWRPLDGSGCAAFDLPAGETELTVEWMRWASWNESPDTGNQLVGYRCDAEMSSCNLDIALETLPANMATGTTVVVVEPISSSVRTVSRASAT
jgi:hypothetical protein